MLDLKDFMAKDIIEMLKEYFKDKEEILLVFVFGSIVGSHMTEESDVDIAILYLNACLISKRYFT